MLTHDVDGEIQSDQIGCDMIACTYCCIPVTLMMNKFQLIVAIWILSRRKQTSAEHHLVLDEEQHKGKSDSFHRRFTNV
jgi:hypothetical protein